jgi:CheY-like chemotaxis protein
MPYKSELAFKTVLLVDDLDPLRQMVRDFLVPLGLIVVEAPNGEKAIHTALTFPSRIDLLLTDIVMPGMSGFEVARRLAEVNPEIKIVYMSSGMTQKQWSETPGVQPDSFFLQKPFRLKDLEALISSLFGRYQQIH